MVQQSGSVREILSFSNWKRQSRDRKGQYGAEVSAEEWILSVVFIEYTTI
jgi:hypothetical protein